MNELYIPSPQPLTKWSRGRLADRFGALSGQAKAIDQELDELRIEFVRRGLERFQGSEFAINKRVLDVMTLPVRKIRAEMGPEWCSQREEPGTRTYWDVAALSKAEAK